MNGSDRGVSDSGPLIPGTFNSRDLGGIPAGAGVVRHAVLIRSDGLHSLDEESFRVMNRLGVRHIVDFRDDNEVARQPDRLDGVSVEVHRLPLLDGSIERSATDGLPFDELYASILRDARHSFATLARLLISQRAETATIVHCSAGKDRTGVAVAVLLLHAGVDAADVVRDYARSEGMLSGAWEDRVIDRIREYGIPVTDSLRSFVVGSPPVALESAISHLDSEYGGATGYLRSAGLSEQELTELRSVLVESAEESQVHDWAPPAETDGAQNS